MTQCIKRRNEDTEQEAVIQWARMSSGKWPELTLLHHIPNGGYRNAAEAARLKRMGVLSGVADLHLPEARAGFHSLYIEMKFTGGRLQDSQREFLMHAAFLGNYCVVCYTAEDAIHVIDNYIRNHVNYENLAIIKEGEKIGIVTSK